MRYRNLVFMASLTLLLFALKRDVAATTWDGCVIVAPNQLSCNFHNAAGEPSCADMDAVCASFCTPPNDYNSGNYSCTNDGGDPPNHGWCLCFQCKQPGECCDQQCIESSRPCCNWTGDVCQLDTSTHLNRCCPLNGC